MKIRCFWIDREILGVRGVGATHRLYQILGAILEQQQEVPKNNKEVTELLFF